MRPEEIMTHLRRSPFQPIRVFVSHGAHYDIRHPEMAAVSRRELVVAVELGADSIPERFAYCDPVHVTRIEPIDGNGRT